MDFTIFPQVSDWFFQQAANLESAKTQSLQNAQMHYSSAGLFFQQSFESTGMGVADSGKGGWFWALQSVATVLGIGWIFIFNPISMLGIVLLTVVERVAIRMGLKLRIRPWAFVGRLITAPFRLIFNRRRMAGTGN